MRKLLYCLILFAFALPVVAEDVTVILKRMDFSAVTLHTMSADIQMLTYTAIIDDKVTEKGTLKLQKKADSVRAIIDFSGQKDASREIGFFGKTVRIYYPKANYFQDYEIGKNTNILNQFLLLGFGSSGKDLAANYTITPEGSEKVSGLTTTKLALIPKSNDVKEHLSKIEIWIPEGESNPIQQQFYEPSGNYRVVTYTHIALNPAMPKNLEIKMQSGTQKRTS